jgi:hypothetical protein
MAALAINTWVTLGLLLLLAAVGTVIAGLVRLFRRGKPQVLAGGLLLAALGWICLRIAHVASAAV